MKKKFVLIALISICILLLLGEYLKPISFTNEKLLRIVYAVIILSAAIISIVNTKMTFQKIIRYAGIWTLIIGGLLTGYTYRNNVKKFFDNIYANIVPGTPIEEKKEGNDAVTIIANQDGHFFVNAVVNGVDIRFLVDTGATDVALTRYDAKKLGIDLNRISYTKRVATANGIAWYAPIKLDYIKVGGIVVYNVSASVSSSDGLNTCLLGMTFLSRLKSYRIRNDSLTMTSE